MLAIENVTRTFENGAGFRNIDLTVNEGEIIGILGTSGCGKSTLLRVLSGLDQGYKGTIKINDEVITSVHEKIGMVFQEARLMPWLNVIENVGFGLKVKDQSERKKKAQQLIQSVGLTGFENQYPKDLSGGMAQRVAIARALVSAPEILLLDEPFSALDAFTKMKLQDLLLSIWNEYKSTFVLVTHDIDEALYLCDRILILRGQPGIVYEELKIDAPRPRARGDLLLAQLKDKVLNLLDLSKQE